MSEVVEQVSKRTGLSVETCQDLLEKGWTYVERIDCVPHWEHPLGRRIEL